MSSVSHTDVKKHEKTQYALFKNMCRQRLYLCTLTEVKQTNLNQFSSLDILQR